MALDFEKMGGLVPAIIQDARDASVIMLGFMNAEAFEMSLRTGRVSFFSRTKQRIWTKGETSGHFLNIVDWTMDCDEDTLLFKVKPEGPSCHLGSKTCFAKALSFEERLSPNFLAQLEDVIEDRIRHSGTTSYTATLYQSGIAKVAQKVGEEAVETVIALMGNSQADIVNESADLIFHLTLGLRAKGIAWEEVLECLRDRHRSKMSAIAPSSALIAD